MKRGTYFTVGRKLAATFVLVFVTFCLTACPPPWPKCDKNEHCQADKKDNPYKKQYYCVQGKCVQCRTANDCPDPQRYKCEGNACVQKTCADIQCPDAKRCDPNTLNCKWICETEGEIPCDGDRCKVCRNHKCVPKPPKCTRDTDCPGARMICKKPGTCDAFCAPGCSAAKPCQTGYKCGPDNKCVIICTPQNIYFDFNKHFIRRDARSPLKDNLECFKKFPNKKVLIEGHCDERGTAEYNIQLGHKRAKSARRYLRRAGLSNSKMCTTSKGKEEPAVPNASTEAEHQKNRRCIFKLVDSCP